MRYRSALHLHSPLLKPVETTEGPLLTPLCFTVPLPLVSPSLQPSPENVYLKTH